MIELRTKKEPGYRQAWAHLLGETTRAEFLAQGIAATRQLAKRQITWLRRFETVPRFDPFHDASRQAAFDAAHTLAE